VHRRQHDAAEKPGCGGSHGLSDGYQQLLGDITVGRSRQHHNGSTFSARLHFRMLGDALPTQPLPAAGVSKHCLMDDVLAFHRYVRN